MHVDDALIAAVTFSWLLLILAATAVQFAKNNRHSILIPIAIHFILCGAPLAADLLLGQPDYSHSPGFYLASRDSRTNLIYCAYVAGMPPLWWWLGRGKTTRRLRPLHLSSNTTVITGLQTLGLLSPAVALALSPHPGAYAKYGAVLNQAFASSAAHDFHPWITLTTVIATACFAAALASWRRITVPRLISTLPLLLLAVWINGKRSIIAIALLLVGYALWSRGTIRGPRLIGTALAATTAFLTFSIAYQSKLRDFDTYERQFSEIAENARVDYGRDDVIKLAIFSELHPEQIRILDHRSQSLLFYMTMFIPRDWWPEKPYPYAHYVTSAVLLTPPRLRSWAVTTSILDEAIANFGWCGMLLGPAFIALICRCGDNSSLMVVRLLTPTVAALFLTVQMVAFAPLFFIWCTLRLLDSRRRTRNSGVRSDCWRSGNTSQSFEDSRTRTPTTRDTGATHVVP